MDDSLKKLKEDMQMLIDAGFAIPDMFEIDPKGAGEILISRDQAKLAEMVAKLKQKKERASRTDVSNAGGAAQGNKAKMMSPQEDVGRQVIDYVHKTMAIDEHWSVREPLGFTWWGHRLAQRVWAEPIPGFLDPPAVRVYAETAFLRNVPHTSKVDNLVDLLNRFASLNAFIWNRTSNRISVRCSASISSDTVGWMRSFFTQAVTIQVIDAHIKATLDDIAGCEIDASTHPQHGPRPDMDEILNVIEAIYAPLGRKPSPFRKSDFEDAARVMTKLSVLGKATESGLFAEFLYYSDVQRPGLISRIAHWFRRQKPNTALLSIDSSVAHPQLGNGAFCRLTLPLELSHERAMQIAADLNRAESRAETDPYLYSFGAWCSDTELRTVSHVMFMPAFIYKPGIINPFLLDAAMRTKWAREYLSQINLGNELATKGGEDGAITPKRTTLSLNPDEAEVHTELGNALFHKGKRDGAVTEYRIALSLNPDNASAHNGLGLALAFDKRDWDGAITEYRTALRLQPDHADAHYNLGVALFHTGDQNGAIVEFRTFLSLNPDDAEAHYYLGLALAAKGYYDEAITEYRTAMRLQPDHADAHYRLGVVLAGKGNLDGAIAEWHIQLRLNPDHAKTHHLLGGVLAVKGDHDGAISEYRIALSLKPNDAYFHRSLGLVLAEKDDCDEAICEYRTALRLKPDLAEAHYNLGIALKAKGQSTEAAHEFREFLRLAPDTPAERQKVEMVRAMLRELE